MSITSQSASTHALKNPIGVCALNAILQLLYLCRIFRQYVLKDEMEKVGSFHKLYKRLFYWMQINNRDKIHLRHKKFYWFVRDNKGWDVEKVGIPCGGICFEMLTDMHKEIVDFGLKTGKIKSKDFTTNDIKDVNDKDYRNIMFGKEDIALNDARMQLLIRNHNSSIINMFLSIYMLEKRCRIGQRISLLL
jgi:hypothetical protein